MLRDSGFSAVSARSVARKLGRSTQPIYFSFQNDVLMQEIISVNVDEFGYEEAVARRFHQDMLYFTYGLAILAKTDHLHLTETEPREAFRREFRTLISIYGKPARLPAFAAKASVS